MVEDDGSALIHCWREMKSNFFLSIKLSRMMEAALTLECASWSGL